MSDEYKIVFLDIETSPNLGYVWAKWQQDVIEFEKEWYILSFAYKERGKKTKVFALPDFDHYKKKKDDDKMLIEELWKVLNDADLVVGHNIDGFDLAKINTRFIAHGKLPPKPYKTVDTLKVAKKFFGFTSNRLNDIAKYLGIGKKVDTGGFGLWLRCIQGDMQAWAKMKKYNAHDVELTELVYDALRPWDTGHPNITLNSGKAHLCPVCSSPRVKRDGWRLCKTYRVQQYQCLNCGHYSSGEREKIHPQVLS